MIWKIGTVGAEMLVDGVSENLRLQASAIERIAGLAQTDPIHGRLVKLQRLIEVAQQESSKVWEELIERNRELRP
jgi:hypothetical protein